MKSHENSFEFLLEVGNPADRGTRTELLDRALHTALKLMDADAAAILTSSSRRGERLVLHAGSAATAKLQLPPEGSEVIRSLAGEFKPLALADLSDDARIATADGCPGVDGPAIFTPLRQRDPAPAYIAAYRRRGRARFSVNDTRSMLLLGAWLSTALENLRLATGTEKLTVTDDLTQIYNYRFLKTALRREIQRASRFAQELSFAVIELDHPDADREDHGDLRGGLLLKELASLLAQQVRSFDVLARYGDDQFMLILPQTSRDGAAEVAERMRAAVEQHSFTPAAAGAMTVSTGVASFPRHGTDIDGLVAAAERALQQAMEQGGNSVVTLAGGGFNSVGDDRGSSLGRIARGPADGLRIQPRVKAVSRG